MSKYQIYTIGRLPTPRQKEIKSIMLKKPNGDIYTYDVGEQLQSGSFITSIYKVKERKYKLVLNSDHSTIKIVAGYIIENPTKSDFKKGNPKEGYYIPAFIFFAISIVWFPPNFLDAIRQPNSLNIFICIVVSCFFIISWAVLGSWRECKNMLWYIYKLIIK